MLRMDILLLSATNKIKVQITGVLKDFPIPDKTFYFEKGDKIKVGTFGISKSSEDSSFGSWVYNTSVKFTPKQLLDNQIVVLLSQHSLIMDFWKKI